MERRLLAPLRAWLKQQQRKPLVLRGARQVGKTWLVRRLAEVAELDLIELNFEKSPNLITLFKTNDVKTIQQNLETVFGRKIDAAHSLLFLDEIQVAPEMLAKLRWFAEDWAQLPVIAAGSLLEFVLAEHTFSMPVGRIGYMHLGPLSFCEFLNAVGQTKLEEYISNLNSDTEIPDIIHNQLMQLFHEYIVVGGLPAAVQSWVDSHSPVSIAQIHHDLINTYQDDFNKYSGRVDPANLHKVFEALPRMLGNKFIYKQVDKELAIPTIKKSLDLLMKARVCSMVQATAANGLPLGAEVQERQFKMIFLDVGLVSTLLGLRLDQLREIDDVNLINKGAIAEQVVGQLLQLSQPYYVEPQLYYWRRDQPGSSAEVDYVIQHQSSIVPVEVKSGKTGSLRSLHLLMAMKQLPAAIRINADLMSVVDVNVSTALDKEAHYKLYSIPVYLTELIPQLLIE